jgi:plastocyanin
MGIALIALSTAALATGGALAGTTSAGNKLPFKASYAGQATVKVTGNVADISAKGAGTGTLIGKGTISGTGTGDSSQQPCVPWTGTGVMTGVEKTRLFFKILPGSQGCGDAQGEVFSILGKASVARATGQLAGAKGTLKVTGVYDRGKGTFSARFTGTLTVASSAVVATTLRISANPRNKLAFTKKRLSAPAGRITIVMKNPSSLRHNVAVRSGLSAKSKLLAKGKVVGKGGTSKVTVVLKKGKYRYVCTVPGHEVAGMWGILTVT